MSTATKGLVYLAGSRWENIGGTDHHLAAALAESVPVLWVDPPLPVQHRLREGGRIRTLELSTVARGVTRLRSLSLPGFTRSLVAPVSRQLLAAAVRAALRKLRMEPMATVLSSPTMRFPAGLKGARVLYATDDWLAGAPLMGLKPSQVHEGLIANLGQADIAAAVSPSLAADLDRRQKAGRPGVVLVPNGCTAPPTARTPARRRRTAALIGQLNERLDMDLLDALGDAAVPVLVIGPRTERDPEVGRRLDRFLSHDNVTWLGRLSISDLHARLEDAAVGLTPYLDNAFNRASFPLKTLDYLAAGIPVVATDLPAVRWLNTSSITVGSSPEQFVQQVQRILDIPPDQKAEERRRAFAGQHSWHARATLLLDHIEGVNSHAQDNA